MRGTFTELKEADEELPPIVDPLDARRPYSAAPSEEMVEEVQGMTDEQHEYLRQMCREDNIFLGYGILGYKDINVRTHAEYSNFITHAPELRRLALMPRGTLKSTLGTITDSLRLALKDPENCRVLILNEIFDNAVGFLKEIKAHIQTNVLLHTLFPELIPERYAGPGVTWSQEEASINRRSVYKEATWTAAGVNTGIVSRHYSRLKIDDIIGIKAKKSPAEMQNAIKVIREIEPLLENIGSDIIDFIGTRKGIHDAYRFVQEFFGDELAVFHRPPILEDGESIFPAKIPIRYLRRLRDIDPVTYYAEYANDPIADGSKDFQVERVRQFRFAANGDVVYRDDDGVIRRWSRHALDVVMACDPNSGSKTAPDFPAIVVLAISPTNQVFLFYAWARRVSAPDYVDKIFDTYLEWDPRVVGIEEAGQQSTAQYVALKAEQEKVWIPWQLLKHKNVPNDIRIRKALQPIINRGRFYMQKEQDDFRHQVTFHPDMENDDLLTAAAYASTMLRKGLSTEEDEKREETIARVLAFRNPVTGY